MKSLLVTVAAIAALTGCAAAPQPEPLPTIAPVVRVSALTCDALLALDEARAVTADAAAEPVPEPVGGAAADLVCLWGQTAAPALTITVDRASGVDFEVYRVDDAHAEWTPPPGADDGSLACSATVCEAAVLVDDRIVHALLSSTAPDPALADRFVGMLETVTTAVLNR